MNRLFNLLAAVCVAVVVLLPKPSVDARPALQGDARDLARVSQLEDALVREPENETVATELAEMYLRLEHPDWALVVLAPFPGKGSSAKVSLLRATAQAERLYATASIAAVVEGREACAAHGCPPMVAARLEVIARPMQALVDQNVDPHKDPQRAKQLVGQSLHQTKPGGKIKPPALEE